MREGEPYRIPPEMIGKERPAVFPDEETRTLIGKFAEKYLALQLKEPLNAPFAKDEREQFVKERGDLDTALTNADSIEKLVEVVEKTVAKQTRKLLPAVLEEVSYKGADHDALVEAIALRDFSNLNAENKTHVMAALGLALIAERARMQMTAEALRSANPEQLELFGMTPEQRDVVALAITKLRKVDPEFLRFRARAFTGEDYPERPVDALRESAHTAQGFREIRESIASITKERGPVFGDATPAFLQYLVALERSYRPLNENGEPYTKEERQKFAENVEKLFEGLHANHPDLPLALLPKAASYVPTGEAELGYDPELRVLWSSPEQRRYATQLQPLCHTFAEALYAQFPEEISRTAATRIAQMRPRLGDDLVSFGAPMSFRVEAQEFGKVFFLIRNREQTELVGPAREAIQKTLGHQWDDIVNTPEFFELMEIQLMEHELAHGIYPEGHRAARRLSEKATANIDETKSDRLAAAFLRKTALPQAQERFGDRADLAINLAVFGNALACSTLDPKSEWRPYYTSAVETLNRAVEQSILIQDEMGRVHADETKLARNLDEEFYLPLAREVLGVYRTARDGSPEEVARSRDAAERLANPTPHPLIEKLREKIISKKAV